MTLDPSTGACTCDNAGMTLDPSTGACTCDNMGMTLDPSTGGCTCDNAGMTLDPTTGACTCDNAGMTLDPSTGACTCDNAGMTLDPSTGACTCDNAGMTLDPISGACTCDNAGMTLDPSTGACTCDNNNETLDPGTGQCFATSFGSVQGSIVIGGTGTRRRRKNMAKFGKDDVKNILKEAFCDNIISGSIVTGSCDLQVLDYDTVTGVAHYILSFEILDSTALKKSLYDINKDIATNTAITGSGQSASPGRIAGASASVQGHLETRKPRKTVSN